MTRQFKFLIGIIGVGVLLIGISILFEKLNGFGQNETGTTNSIIEENESNYQESKETKKDFDFHLKDTLNDNYFVITLDYNIETKSRYFIRQKTGKDQVSCQVIKKNNLKSGKYPSNLLIKDITDVLKIPADSVELFIQKLQEKCGCQMKDGNNGSGNSVANGPGGKARKGVNRRNGSRASGNSNSGDEGLSVDKQ